MLDTERVKITHPKGVWYPNIKDDYEWLHEHRKELLETYGPCAILIYQGKVVGVGKTMQDAVQDADSRLPADSPVITPFSYYLNYPHRIRRVHSTDKDNPVIAIMTILPVPPEARPPMYFMLTPKDNDTSDTGS